MVLVGIIFLALLIGFVTYTGLSTRCPMCGAYGLHPKDLVAEAEQQKSYAQMQQVGLVDAFEATGMPLGKLSKPGFSNRNLRCRRCGHAFHRTTAVIWHRTANKLGEYTAVSEYRKLMAERERSNPAGE